MSLNISGCSLAKVFRFVSQKSDRNIVHASSMECSLALLSNIAGDWENLREYTVLPSIIAVPNFEVDLYGFCDLFDGGDIEFDCALGDSGGVNVREKSDIGEIGLEDSRFIVLLGL